MKIYDAENQILGRFSSVIAKQLLNGESVAVVNAEKAVLAGNAKAKITFYKHKYERGDPLHGPFFPKQPERILRRTVRGMLPWDRKVGRDAYRRLKVCQGVPVEFSGKSFERVAGAESSRLKTKFITLGEISFHMGAKRRL